MFRGNTTWSASRPQQNSKHDVMSDIIFRSLSSVGIPASKESTDLTTLKQKYISSHLLFYFILFLLGKRPDDLTLAEILYRLSIESLTQSLGKEASQWHGTSQCGRYACSVLPPVLHASGHSAAGAAELAVSRKEAKYSCLPQSFLFVPIALETLGAIAPCSFDFLTEVGRRLSAATARRCAGDGILVSAHLCHTSTVQCGTHTWVFCHTRRRAGPLAILCVFSERELKFTFAICHRRSVCRLSVVCLSACRL